MASGEVRHAAILVPSFCRAGPQVVGSDDGRTSVPAALPDRVRRDEDVKLRHAAQYEAQVERLAGQLADRRRARRDEEGGPRRRRPARARTAHPRDEARAREVYTSGFRLVSEAAMAIGDDIEERGRLALVQGAAVRQRIDRLQRDLERAFALLCHADTCGIAVDPQTRKEVIEVADATAAGVPTALHEQQLGTACAKLYKATAPVTAETIAAFALQEPARCLGHAARRQAAQLGAALPPGDLLRRAVRHRRRAGLPGRRRERDEAPERTVGAVHGAARAAAAARRARARQAGRSTSSPSARRRRRPRCWRPRARHGSAQAKATLNEKATIETGAERRSTARQLQQWSRLPCAVWMMCGSYDPAAPAAAQADDALVPAMSFEAQSMIDRMNQVVLPMLLGLLGAYAYVLRAMTRDIRSHTFQPNALLHHVVRLSLGALAGIAVGWFLTPQQLGLDKNAPTWVLAFLAGYGTDSLFALLDRLIGGISGKAKEPA
jgi:hypothetical protein